MMTGELGRCWQVSFFDADGPSSRKDATRAVLTVPPGGTTTFEYAFPDQAMEFARMTLALALAFKVGETARSRAIAELICQ